MSCDPRHSRSAYVIFFFFFLMIRRPPRSTLFPTRRSSDLLLRLNHAQDLGVGRGLNPAPDERGPATWRSEEHTSELQSQSNLVCRLLLEKKNTSPSKS